MTKTMLRGAACAAALAVGFAGAAGAGDLTGRVTDAGGAAALQGVEVRIDELDRRAVTGRDGAYRFIDVPPGAYTLTISAIGSAPESLPVEIGAEDARRDIAYGATLLQAEQIVVLGQRGSLFDALNQKRASDTFIDVLSSDAIGQFPDENVSESVRRVTGVLVENDQGEGRFVTIRGLNPELNATSINGVRTPAPENDIRGVALDVIDSEVLEGITINKSLTPDMDGDAIGGSIDIRTTTAFDRGEGLSITGELGGSYNELTEEVTPKIAGSLSDIFMDGRFGVAISGSYREREFATENQEVDGAWQSEDGVLWNEELELRDYVVTRERTNVTANFDFRPNANHDLYFRTLFSEFSDLEFRRRVEFKLEDAAIAGVDQAADTVLFAAGPNDVPEEDPFLIEIDRDSKDRLEVQQIWSFQAGGESRLDAWTVDYSAAFSRAEEEEPDPGNIDVVTFRLEEEDGGFLGFNSTDPINPRIIRPAVDSVAIDDPAAFEVDEWELIRGATEDEEIALTLNVRRDFTAGAFDAYVKGGAKLRRRDKFFDALIEIYEEGDVTLADFTLAEPLDFPLDAFGPFPDPGAISQFFFANQGGAVVLNAEDTAIASIVEDYDAEENITAGYIMGGIDRGPLSIVGGLRFEATDVTANATQVRDGDLVPVTFEDDYGEVLPSITGRYELTDDIILRAAYYRALARPSFGAFAPRAEIEDIEGLTAESAAGGNPNIRHQVADNFDFGAEWYVGNNGLLSAAVFHKEIDDYIAEIVLTDTNAFGLQIDEFETFTNLRDASLTGVELGYQQSLTMLPAPFDGIILGANVTFLDGDALFGGEGTDATERRIDLPKLSDMLANLVIGYDKGPIDIRVSMAHRSEFLDEINGGFDDGLDRIVDDHTQWDITGRFRLTDNVRLYGELKNINDEPFLAFTNFEDQQVLLQYEEYGYTANFGIKITY